MADTLFVNATTTVPGTPIVAPWMNDVNTSVYDTLSAVVGTNTITATGPLSLASYSSGQNFYFIPAVTNTTAVTINISGLGVKNITKYGTTALVAGDLVAGMSAEISYDGTRFQLVNPRNADVSTATGILPVANGGTGVAGPALGRLINIQTFLVSGTYTPTAGTNRIYVIGQGSGGGGGGCGPIAAGQVSVGGGGSSGAYGEAYITSGFAGTTVTIGSAGVGSAGSNGSNAGASSFGAFLTLPGGLGGTIGVAAPIAAASGGAVVSAGGTALLFPSAGVAGDSAVSSFAAGWANSGKGGSSIFGSGGQNTVTGGPSSGGATAPGRGAGGGGAAGVAAGAAAAGGNGALGLFIVYEYA